MALQREGRQQEAIPWFRKAIEREPHNVSALTNLGLALTLTGKANEAQADFQQALALSPKTRSFTKTLALPIYSFPHSTRPLRTFKKPWCWTPTTLNCITTSAWPANSRTRE